MSQTLQNQIMMAKSMNGIIELSDGAGTSISNGQISTNDLSSNTFGINNLTINNKNILSSVKIVSGATSLLFGDPEYILIDNTSSFTITLPTVGTGNIGSQFLFFLKTLTSTTNVITIATATGQNALSYFENGINNTFSLNYNVSGGSQANLSFYTFFAMQSSGSYNWILTNPNLSWVYNSQNIWKSLNTFNDLVLLQNGVNIANAITLNNNVISGSATFNDAQLFNNNLTISSGGYFLPTNIGTLNYRIGQDAQKNILSTTSNNLSFGYKALECSSTLTTLYKNNCSSNLCFGHYAGQKLTSDISGTWSSDNNVILGNNTAQNTFFNSYSNVMIGNNCGKFGAIHQNNVLIGHNCNSTGGAGLTNSVIIGAESLKGISGKGSICCVGYNNGQNLNDNGITIFGTNNCTSAIQNNGGIVVGSNSVANINSTFGIISIGNNTALNFIGNNSSGGGGYSIFIGTFADTTVNHPFNSVAIGYTAKIQADNEFVLGGYNNSTLGKLGYPRVCIPTKNYIFCVQNVATNLTLQFRSEEYVLITSSSVTSITLPQPSGNSYDNMGAVFTLIKTFVGSSTISVNAPFGQTMLVAGVAVSSYSMSASITFAKFLCVASTGSTWQLITNDSNGFVLPTNVAYLNVTQTFTAPQTINTLITNSGMQIIPDGSAYIKILDSSSNNVLRIIDSVNSIAIGKLALNLEGTVATPSQNVAVGAYSLSNLASSRFCTAVGVNALTNFSGTGGGYACATAVGNASLFDCTTGYQNTALGASSGLNVTTGSFNTFLGYGSGFASSFQFNQSTALGYSALITQPNQIMLGTASETTVIPSAKVQFGGSYLLNKTFFSISANLDWNVSPPSNLPHYICFSATGAGTITLTLPQISNANVFEGMEFQFRRTNYTASSTTTSVLSTSIASGSTDTIFGNGLMTQASTSVILASGAYTGRLVVINKTTTPYNWAYFP